jgi:hypothetical protein
MGQTLTEASLEQFHGSEQLYKHPFYGPMRYTEGARHVAVAGEAWWLLDILGTEAHRPPLDTAWMQVWTLTVQAVHGRMRAVLVCTDGGKGDDASEKELMRHAIGWTDFPLDTITLWVVDHVIMLPSEY